MHTIILDLILRRIRVKAEEINQLLKNIYMIKRQQLKKRKKCNKEDRDEY